MTQIFATLFSFKYRLPRAAFWGWGIAAWMAFAVLFVFLDTSLGRPSTYILYPPFLWILAALLVKRLHDRGSSAWNLALLLIPVLGPLWITISLAFRKGTEGDNQYGPDPFLINVDYLTVH